MEIEKMNKYQNGKIYVIRSPSTDKIYIGSTIEKYLSNRFGGHNRAYSRFLNGTYHNVTSFELIKLGDSYIELLELFPCNSKLELCKREGEQIREHKLNCVNRCIAGRTVKEWASDNKEAIKEKKKQYCEINKDVIQEKEKQKYKDNKDTIKEQIKQFYEKNKDAINEKRKQTYICECGTESTISHKSRHEKTNKHQEYINNPI